jgi:large subunit ribosomal protein L21
MVLDDWVAMCRLSSLPAFLLGAADGGSEQQEDDPAPARGHETKGYPMFAIIKTGGKQYRVAVDDVLTIERLPGVAGEITTFETVLMLGGESAVVGAPTVPGASVAAEIVGQVRGPKVISFKKRRRQNSKRKKGHRQDLTEVRILEILTDGRKTSAVARPRAEPAAEVAAAPAALMAAAPGGLDETNLSLISGVGPTIEKKLRAAGITTWSQIAAWTEADVARWNDELKLANRATREEWVEQARELLAGKPPRAKVDQVEKAAGDGA